MFHPRIIAPFVLASSLLNPVRVLAAPRPEVFGVQKDAAWVQLSPDGKLLAATASDGTGKVWDIKTRRPLWKLNGDNFIFSPDGRVVVQVIGAEEDPEFVYSRSLRFDVRQARTGRTLRSFSDPKKRPFKDPDRFVGHVDSMLDYGFTSDGREFLLLTRNFLRRWNVGSGRLIAATKWRSPFRTVVISSASLSRDGKTVVALSNNVRIFDARTARQTRVLDVRPSEVFSLSPDDFSFCCDFDGSGTKILRLSDGKLLRRSSQIPAFSRNGKTSYVPAKTGFDVLDAHTGRKLRHLSGPTSDSSDPLPSPSPDGNWLYEAHGGKIWRWRAR